MRRNGDQIFLLLHIMVPKKRSSFFRSGVIQEDRKSDCDVRFQNIYGAQVKLERNLFRLNSKSSLERWINYKVLWPYHFAINSKLFF